MGERRKKKQGAHFLAILSAGVEKEGKGKRSKRRDSRASWRLKVAEDRKRERESTAVVVFLVIAEEAGLKEQREKKKGGKKRKNWSSFRIRAISSTKLCRGGRGGKEKRLGVL